MTTVVIRKCEACKYQEYCKSKNYTMKPCFGYRESKTQDNK